MRGDQVGNHGQHRDTAGLASPGPDRRAAGQRMERHNGRRLMYRHRVSYRAVGQSQQRPLQQPHHVAGIAGVVDGSPRPRSETDHRTVQACQPPQQRCGAWSGERVAQHGVEPARVRLLKGLADRPGRAAMSPARVGHQKEQGHPPRPAPGRALRRRPVGAKQLSHLTSRPGINQHHAFIVTMHRSAVVSLWDGPDCFPGRLRAARPTSAVAGARSRAPPQGSRDGPGLLL